LNDSEQNQFQNHFLFFFLKVFGGIADTNPLETGWFVPKANGNLRWMSLKEYQAEISNIEPKALQVKFYLYTRANPTTPKQISVNDVTALSSSKFNKYNPTRFIIHGWQSNYQAEVNTVLRKALLASGDFNVFSVDWSANAETLNYSSARYSVPDVGTLVAAYLDFLYDKGGMSFSTLTVIGHSLGAHVSGFAGKRVKRGKINTIIGLDPAYPLFNYNDCTTRLCPTDASYVESIQTNGGLLGFIEPIGKAAFYPNGGKSQPGCGIDAAGACAHARSYLYYGEALEKNDFPTMKCSSYELAVKKDCGSTYSSVRMGSKSNYGISGYFYVPVNKASPFGMAS